MKVLITGFDPFGGENINPAFEAVKKIGDEINSCQVLKLEIPTVFYKSIEILEKAIIREKPDLVLCVGQAGGRSSISIEQVAINLNEARIPDNEGNKPSGSKVMDDGENAYFTNIPSKAILKDLHNSGIPSSLSYTAGTYVCNHIFYGLMYLIDKKYKNIRGGFIHVPFMPAQVLEKPMASMGIGMIAEALEIIIKASLANDSDIDYSAGETH